GKSTLVETRKEVEQGWHATSALLTAQGRPDLTAEGREFLAQMAPPRTEKEALKAALLERVRVAKNIIEGR
ncbi:MAG: hypothetical protein ACRETP_07960, partial [Steroidobacteraceae bacterium]